VGFIQYPLAQLRFCQSEWERYLSLSEVSVLKTKKVRYTMVGYYGYFGRVRGVTPIFGTAILKVKLKTKQFSKG